MKRIMSDLNVVVQNRKYSEENIFFNIQSSTDLESELITQVQNANKCKSSFIPAANSGGSPASSPVSAEGTEYSN